MSGCIVCGRPPIHGEVCGYHRCDALVCTCEDPLVDGLGECQSCRRKPARLLGVIGREALVAAGARVTSPAEG